MGERWESDSVILYFLFAGRRFFVVACVTVIPVLFMDLRVSLHLQNGQSTDVNGLCVGLGFELQSEMETVGLLCFMVLYFALFLSW